MCRHHQVQCRRNEALPLSPTKELVKAKIRRPKIEKTRYREFSAHAHCYYTSPLVANKRHLRRYIRGSWQKGCKVRRQMTGLITRKCTSLLIQSLRGSVLGQRFRCGGEE